MTNPTTYYCVGTKDLSEIFQPIAFGSSSTITTNYSVNGYGDLNNIFAKLPLGVQGSPTTTNFAVNGYGDLNTIFAPYNPYYVANGTYTVSIPPNTFKFVITFTGNGTLQLTDTYYKCICLLVGGGGGGGAGPGGGGGGGGEIKPATIITRSKTATYTISIGTGSDGAIQQSTAPNAESGTESSISTVNAGIIITAKGGEGGWKDGNFGGQSGGINSGGQGGKGTTSTIVAGVDGTVSSINSSYGGGGGGGSGGGSGGSGPNGGNGGSYKNNGSSAGANTGGGGGGAGAGGGIPTNGGSGGSGVAIFYLYR